MHPAQVCNTLSSQQIEKLWQNTVDVCKTAVELNADHNRFPTHWLFRYRWGKSHASRKLKAKKESADYESSDGGEKIEQGARNLGKTMTTKDKRVLNIEWITCGGRTSAFVVDEQVLPSDAREEKNHLCNAPIALTSQKSGKAHQVIGAVDSNSSTPRRKRKNIKQSQIDGDMPETAVMIVDRPNKRMTRSQSKT